MSLWNTAADATRAGSPGNFPELDLLFGVANLSLGEPQPSRALPLPKPALGQGFTRSCGPSSGSGLAARDGWLAQ